MGSAIPGLVVVALKRKQSGQDRGSKSVVIQFLPPASCLDFLPFLLLAMDYKL